MGIVKCHIAMSLDGYSAGPNQGPEHPLGEGGDRLHEWAYELDAWHEEHGRTAGEHNASSEVLKEAIANVGAGIMGRGMFGGGPGPWPDDPPWNGWWGSNPPFHVPMFVLTHHPRESVEMEGGTTFHFVTDGIESAVAQAREAAGDKDVSVNGGPSTVSQAIRAGLLDELVVHVAPVALGGGEPLLQDIGEARLEPVRAVAAPKVSHLKFRVTR